MLKLNTEEITIEVPGSIYRIPLEMRLRSTSETLGNIKLMPPVNGKSHLYLNLDNNQKKNQYQEEVLLGLCQYLFATQGIREIKVHGLEPGGSSFAQKNILTPADIDLEGHKRPVVECVIVILLSERAQVLLGKRPPGKFMSGVWEFPGGKLEKGEGIMSAAVREVYEELGVQIADYQSLRTLEFQFNDFKLKGYLAVVSRWKGTPQALVHTELRWVSLKELPYYSMPLSNLICIHDVMSLVK